MTTIESDPLTLFDVPPARPVIDTRPLGHSRAGEAPTEANIHKGCREVLFALRLIGRGTTADVQALVVTPFERNVIARRLNDLEKAGLAEADRTTRPITWSVR